MRHAVRESLRLAFLRRAPSAYAVVQFRKVMGVWPDLRHPHTLNEKITWLMLHDADPLRTRCGDKLALRGWVDELRLSHLLPELHAVWERVEDVDLRGLPERFFLKCTHGCGFNIACTGKSSFDIDTARRRLGGWMRTDYSLAYGEPHYAGMSRRILCEEYLDDRRGALPVDYKAYTFGGRVHCFAVGTNRTVNGEAQWDAYDPRWERKLPYYKGSIEAGRKVSHPASLEEMVAAAAVLGKPFPFARIDFYDVGGRARLGEMTFTPAAGRDPRLTATADREMGALLELPRR